MRKTYLVLSRTISVLIVVQAMMIVFVVAGLFHWIDGGGTLDKSVVDGWDDNPPTWQGSFGAFVHFFLVGVVLIPLSGLLLLIVSFFAKVPRGVVLAVAIVVDIAIQYAAAVIADSAPWVGLIHGLNAFVLLGLSVAAAMAAKSETAPVATAPAAPAT